MNSNHLSISLFYICLFIYYLIGCNLCVELWLLGINWMVYPWCGHNTHSILSYVVFSEKDVVGFSDEHIHYGSSNCFEPQTWCDILA